jgi:hypothetical protein
MIQKGKPQISPLRSVVERSAVFLRVLIPPKAVAPTPGEGTVPGIEIFGQKMFLRA